MYEQFTDHILSVMKGKIPAPARKIYKIYNRWIAHLSAASREVDSPVIELQRVCRFVGLVRSVQDIKIAIERSSFKRLQVDFRNHKLFAGKSVGVKGGPVK